jgi:hypothetical protein
VEVKGGSMKIVLSKKLHAPVVKIGDSTVTIWHYFARRSLMNEISKNFVLSEKRMAFIICEWKDWVNYYLPKYANKDTVIVDVGAGEGETAIFFYLHGYRNFVLIEKEPNKNIYLNAMALTNLGCSVTVLLQPFSLAMFDKIPGYENCYFKLDCEGCEKEFLEAYHPFEFSLELHPGAGRISDIIKMYGGRVLDFKEWYHGYYYVHVAPAIIPREPSFVE